MCQLDEYINIVSTLLAKKRDLAKKRRQLQVRGYEAFIEDGSIELLMEAKRINSQIVQISTEIEFIQQNDFKVRLQCCRNSSDFRKISEIDFFLKSLGRGKG